MTEWIETHEATLWWLAAGSVATFVGTLVAVPWLIVRIPADYFTHRKRQKAPWADQHRFVRAALMFAKNVFGCVFLVAGVLMLLLPGQGILTIFIGTVLLDFPGKYRLERWAVSRSRVLRSINWLRRRAGQDPLVLHR